MARRIYIVEKKVRASPIQEALEKEKNAEIKSVYKDSDEDDEREMGFRARA